MQPWHSPRSLWAGGAPPPGTITPAAPPATTTASPTVSPASDRQPPDVWIDGKRVGMDVESVMSGCTPYNQPNPPIGLATPGITWQGGHQSGPKVGGDTPGEGSVMLGFPIKPEDLGKGYTDF